jgi:hypothetical protein
MRRVIVGMLLLSFLSASFPARAELIGTDSALDGAGERARIMKLLESYGAGAEGLDARIAALTDQEVRLLASQIDTLPAGGDGGATATAIVVLISVIYGFVWWYFSNRRLQS